MKKPTKLKKKSKKKIRKLASFLGDLARRKLNMGIIARTDDSKEMDPYECDSAACGMGWGPVVFPDELQYAFSDATLESDLAFIQVKGRPDLINFDAISYVLKIPRSDSEWLFGTGAPKYETPKQVSKGLRKYAKTGLVPRRCFEEDYQFKAYMEGEYDDEEENLQESTTGESGQDAEVSHGGEDNVRVPSEEKDV